MIVCDRCKTVDVKASDVALVLTKNDATGKKAGNPKYRTVVEVKFALCEGCIKGVIGDVFHFVRKIDDPFPTPVHKKP